jgi:hypothetical protein
MHIAFRWILGIIAILLAGAIALQLLAYFNQPPILPSPQLAKMIPTELPGWEGRELPLADTEEGRIAVSNSLQFDQHVSRIYTRGKVSISIYVAYWEPNKVPPRLVGVHTPDTCWIMNGWACTKRVRAVPLKLIDSTSLMPAEVGTYTFAGTVQYVYFWHLVDGHVYAYEQEGPPSFSTIRAQLEDLKFGFRQRREQYFIRIASNQPWYDIWLNPGVQELFGALARLGLAVPATIQ